MEDCENPFIYIESAGLNGGEKSEKGVNVVNGDVRVFYRL